MKRGTEIVLKLKDSAAGSDQDEVKAMRLMPVSIISNFLDNSKTVTEKLQKDRLNLKIEDEL